MACPRCGFQDVSGTACPRCGVVFDKLRGGDGRRATPLPARLSNPRAVPTPRSGGRASGVILGAGLLAVAGVAAWILVPGLRPRATAPPVAGIAAPDGVAPVAPGDGGPAEPPVLDFAPGPAPAAPPVDGTAAEELSEAERSLLDAAAVRLPDQVSANDLPALEQLFQARPNVARVREILTATLLAVAKADLAARRLGDARARLERAAQVSPADPRPYIGLHNAYAAELDWARAEAAIRAALERDPSSAQALRALAFTLYRQDRNQEAREVLRPLVENGDGEARDLLARIEGGLRDEAGMTEKRLAHFHVRYDGEEHTTVGHEILRALERHYGTLKLTLGFEPQTVIPVILFSREAYYDAAGAPAWSGGAFDQLDGRIRIPIGGLTASLTPDIDDTLLHELTHAFVYDRTRGLAPRDIHEGLAQYLEGKRLERLLDQQSAAALARGQIPGVAGFYLEALAFVEYLMVQRGQSGMNDLLRLMGETGSLDRAFDEVYGRDYEGMRKAWRERFQRDTL